MAPAIGITGWAFERGVATVTEYNEISETHDPHISDPQVCVYAWQVYISTYSSSVLDMVVTEEWEAHRPIVWPVRWCGEAHPQSPRKQYQGTNSVYSNTARQPLPSPLDVPNRHPSLP